MGAHRSIWPILNHTNLLVLIKTKLPHCKGQDFDNVGIGFQFDRHEVGHVKE